MKIGIIGAMEVEVEFLKEALKDRKDKIINGFEFSEGKIGNHEVVVLLSGIGKVSAAVATTLLINKYQPELLINTGTAGGLKDSKVYDIILATEVRHHDVDVTAFGYEIGQQAKMPPAFSSDENWLKKAENHCKKYSENIRLGVVVSGDSFISDRERKLWIEEKFPMALAVEMEASAIAQTCYILGVPFLMLRAISDSAGEGDTVSYDTFVEKAGHLSAEMNISFIENL
ncbi:MAG: 5'-methylthioadenosine/adenosylhomocysteine nucleosidase [Flavobacteriaceae bacterium]|nr:5'-methylthioadenosine/adenosylhomocysteine nucleosidase [Flavobacteriaceae bacterium]